MAFPAGQCILCHESNKAGLTAVTEKGLVSLKEYSALCSPELLLHLEEDDNNNKIYLHRNCQKKVYNILRHGKRKSTNVDENEIKKTRLSTPQFDWTLHCLYCGLLCKIDSKHPDRKTNFRVLENDTDSRTKQKSVDFRNHLLTVCESRKDKWAEDVQSRVINCLDFVSVRLLLLLLLLFHYTSFIQHSG